MANNKTFGIGLGQVAGAVGGGIMGAIGANSQHRRQKELMDKQFNNQSRLNQQGHQMQKDMWEFTNYPNQVKMMLEAGLSPAMMYGGSGAGGATTGGQGGGAAAGGQAAAMDVAQMGAMARLGAETDLIKAQTDKTEAEAQNISAGTDKIGAEIENLQKDIETKTQGILESQSAVKLNQSIANLNSVKAQEVIQNIEINKKDLEYMRRTGLSRISPEVAKTIKYLSEQTNIKEENIIQAIGVSYGLGMFGKFVGDVSGAIGKAAGAKAAAKSKAAKKATTFTPGDPYKNFKRNW